MCIYIYIYMHVCICISICISICVYIWPGRRAAAGGPRPFRSFAVLDSAVICCVNSIYIYIYIYIYTHTHI